MKNIIKLKNKVALLTLCAFVCVGMSSCLEDYLDRTPGSGMDDKEVFTKYANFKNYLESVYYGGGSTDGAGDQNIKPHFPLFFARWDQKATLESVTDMCDMARMQYAQLPKRGVGSEAFAGRMGYYKDRAKVPYSWKAIRIMNKCIENIDMVQNISQTDRDDFLGQAHFVRAFCHFELFRFYGSLPYIKKSLGPDDKWDLPRPTAQEMLKDIADDFEMAAQYFKSAGLMRRDPAGGAGHLDNPNQDKPNGVAAKAFKARALLYAASPLNNESGDQTLWQDAAAACWEALDVALQSGYALLPKADYTKNFYGTKYTNEQIWANSPGSMSFSNGSLETFIPRAFSGQANASGQCPTENFVSRFETEDGYPLYTSQERTAAITAGKYNDQNPYTKRDPRLDVVVVYNQKPVDGYGAASLYIEEDGTKPANSLIPNTPVDRYSRTGYYECKRTGPLAQKSSVKNLTLTDPIIRLAELYLNYSEAANEAYGPNGSAPGASLTALEAVNAVRNRVGMPDVMSQFASSKDLLRPRIKNERIIELCFEGFHYYCDIRRWKDAPEIMGGTLYKIEAIKLSVSNQDPVLYPTGFKYSRVAMDADRQVAWVNGMYYIPFISSELLKMSNYVPNQAW